MRIMKKNCSSQKFKIEELARPCSFYSRRENFFLPRPPSRAIVSPPRLLSPSVQSSVHRPPAFHYPSAG